MIVNPYQELISLHDMRIENIEIKDNTAYIKLNNAYLLGQTNGYMLDEPLIIINDLINIEANSDYPIRIRVYGDKNIFDVNISDFNKYTFDILEEAYGFGLVHFFSLAMKYQDNIAYDCFLDIHFTGDLEIKWDNKVLLGV